MVFSMPTVFTLMFCSVECRFILFLPFFVYIGPEWDSSDEETPIVPLESNKKRVPVKSKSTKAKNKLQATKPKRVKQSRVIYMGHLPQNFAEPELMGFLSQFGVVTRLKLSRSRKTGNPRGFAFVEFANSQVAAIVAETMSGYFLQEKRLVCHIVPLEKIRKDLFDGWDRKFTKVDWKGKHREQVNKEKTADVMNVITKRLLAREQKKKAALKAMGIDYDFPGYEASAAVVVAEEELTGDEPSGKTKKRRKESLDAQAKAGEDESPTKKQRSIPDSSDVLSKKKKARKDSIDSQGSASNKKKKARTESIDSQGSSSEKKGSKRKDSMESHGSSSVKKGSRRKDSMDSQGSSSKQKKRKDSMDSVGSSSSGKKKHSKRKSKEDSSLEETPTKSSEKHAAKTEVKKKKTAKQGRAST